MSTSNPPFLDPSRLLSVQSHVCSGYVGNRAATFPLQLLGYDVDAVNTVQFSNHTGYGHTNGHKTTPEQLDAVFKGLETNGLSRWSRCLTGYIPGAPAVQAVGREIKRLQDRAKARNEDVLYLLDPVMGDIGKGLYVAEDVVPIYRDMLSQASIITPNQFETELLSETKITSISALHKALSTLHSPPYNVPHVVISSIPLPLSLVAKLDLPGAPPSYTSLLPAETSASLSRTGSAISLDSQKEGYEDKSAGGIRVLHEQGDEGEEPTVLVCFASTLTSMPTSRSGSGSGSEDEMETHGYALPTIQGYYSGVGDLFSALVLGHYRRSESTTEEKGKGKTLERAVSLALLGVQQVLLKTHLSTLSPKSGGTSKADGEAECVPSDEELDKETIAGEGNDGDVRPSRRARRMRLRELRIVQERALLMRLADDMEGGWEGKRLDWDSLLRVEER